VGEVDAGCLRASDPHRSAHGARAEVPRGLRGSEGYRRQGIEGEEQLTGDGPRLEFRRYTGRGHEGRAWEASWRWGGADVALAGAGVQQGGRSTAEQEARCGGARRPVVLGVWGGCNAAVGHKGGLRGGLKGPVKGEAGDLGVRAPMGIAAVIHAGEADCATAQRDPGSGKEACGGRAHTGDWLVGSRSGAGWSGATCSDGTAGRNRGSRRGEEEGKEGEGDDRRARAVRERKRERGLCCAGLSVG
jgi:hypothetical protein